MPDWLHWSHLFLALIILALVAQYVFDVMAGAWEHQIGPRPRRKNRRRRRR